MNESDNQRLREIREREGKATPDWIDKGGDAFGVIADGQCLLATAYMTPPNWADFRYPANREFVVHSRADIPFLLSLHERDSARIKELEVEVSALKIMVEAASNGWDSANAALDSAIKKAEAITAQLATVEAENVTVFCEQCAVRVPLNPIQTIRTSDDQQPWADILCPTCHFVIATIGTSV